MPPSACRWCGRVARVPIWAQPSVRARFLTPYACVSHFGFALVSYARDAPCSPQTLLGLWQRSLSRPHASPCNTKTWSLGLWPHGGDLGHRPTIRELLRFPVLQIYIEHSPAGGVTDETGQWQKSPRKVPGCCFAPLASLGGSHAGGWLSTRRMCAELAAPAARFILRILCALEKCGQTLCRGNNNVFR